MDKKIDSENAAPSRRLLKTGTSIYLFIYMYMYRKVFIYGQGDSPFVSFVFNRWEVWALPFIQTDT